MEARRPIVTTQEKAQKVFNALHSLLQHPQPERRIRINQAYKLYLAYSDLKDNKPVNGYVIVRSEHKKATSN